MRAEGLDPPAVDLRSLVRDVPDFPRSGIVFKDITPLLLDARALDACVTGLARFAAPLGVDLVVAAEARGFILGAALARALGAGFVPARKPGKLPRATVTARYALEYGTDALQVHTDALVGGARMPLAGGARMPLAGGARVPLGAGARVLIHDDLLATGGTARALVEIVSRLGAEVVGCAFLVELSFLGGRARLAPHQVHALIEYEQ